MMMCPNCDFYHTYIIDTRTTDGYTIKRRRKCPDCGYRFTTVEHMIQMGFLNKDKPKT